MLAQGSFFGYKLAAGTMQGDCKMFCKVMLSLVATALGSWHCFNAILACQGLCINLD